MERKSLAAMVYPHVLGGTARLAGLLKSLRPTGLAQFHRAALVVLGMAPRVDRGLGSRQKPKERDSV
jgi:hypothetical protein